jgi:acetoacetate decarboxylase
MSAAASHPPAPWRLAGPALIAPLRVRADAARRHLPTGARPVPAGPGRVLGGIVLVSYEPGSTLVYDELVVACAIALERGWLGLCVSHIWVDDERSVSGGRSIWGLPKGLARFERRGVPGDGRVEVHVDGRLALAAEARPARARVPLPLAVPTLGTVGDGRVWAFGRGLGRLGPTRVRIDVPPESPLAELGIAGTRLALAGRADPLVFPPARPLAPLPRR